MIGQTISHYRITAKIGEGGMGEVYLAEDTKLHRQVALKFLPESLRRDAEARERLVREARAASRLSHPNIVTVHSIEESDGRDFIVMEYVDGKPVDQYCRERLLGLQETIGIAIGLTIGLSKAHEAGITHRDLKPSNILIERDGRARVLDFGLAKIEGAAKLTKTGSTVGTVAYMSPEQGRGEEADHRSDIFSIGVILYEMITGHAPFGGDHEAAILYAVASQEPEPLARYKRDVPEELQQVVSKCLAKRRQDRYQSAADLATDLKRIRRELAPPSSSSRSAATARRHANARILLPIVVAAVIALILLITRPWETSSESQRQSAGGEKTLVVLPFENLGSDEDEYFADGITDEITSRLAQIPGLHVISRTSAMQYKNTNKHLQQIGSELGVAYVLEGTIRWDKSTDTSRVRITPQLIKVDNDFHVWAENYERAMTQIFTVQADIAGHIASALDVALEDKTESVRPTDDLDAYDFYLRGKEYLKDALSENDVHTAIGMFEQAIALDSGFAAAYAAFGKAKATLYWDFSVGTMEGLDSAKASIDQALSLDPDLAEAHAALGHYYNWVKDEYALALEEFSHARQLGAKAGEIYTAIANVQMRQGQWADAEENLLEALAVDPLSLKVRQVTASLYGMLRRYEDGLRIIDRALALAPNEPELHSARAHLILSGRGDTARAGEFIRDVLGKTNSARMLGVDSYYGSDIEASLWRYRLVEVTPGQARGSFPSAMTLNDTKVLLFALGSIFDLAGQQDSARFYLDSLIVVLKSEIEAFPDNFHPMAAAAVTCMVAGYHDDARRFGRMGMETMPISACHW